MAQFIPDEPKASPKVSFVPDEPIDINTGDSSIQDEYNQLYIDNSQRSDALIRGDFAERTLTLNALQVIIPNLPTYPDGLPSGALWRHGNVVMVVE